MVNWFDINDDEPRDVVTVEEFYNTVDGGFGDKMTIKEFKDACESNSLIDDDGWGIIIDNSVPGEISYTDINPSDYISGRIDLNEFTHVIWYNK